MSAPGLHQPLAWSACGVFRFCLALQHWRWVQSSIRWLVAGTMGCSTRRPFPVTRWAVTRAEAAEAVSMQGWQLAGGCASPHSLYFCGVHMTQATKTDDVIGSVSPSCFCIDLQVHVSAFPLPCGSWRAALGSGCSACPSLCWWGSAVCSLQAPPAPCRLKGTDLFSEACSLSSLGMGGQ